MSADSSRSELEEKIDKLEEALRTCRRLKESVEKSERSYRKLVEEAADVAFSVARDGTVKSLNAAFESLTGHRRQDWIGRYFGDIIHPEDLKAAAGVFRSVLQGKSSPIYEMRILSKSRGYITGQFTSTPLIEGEKVVGVMGIARDISELKRAEKALKESEEKYRSVVELSNDGICIVLDTNFQYVNEQLAMLMGRSREEILNESFADYIAPDELPKVMRKHEEFLSGRATEQRYGTALLHKEGRRVEVEVNVGITAYEGRKAGLVFVRDITERKRAEDALRKERDFNKTLIQASPLFFVTIDPKGKTVMMNESMLDALGYRLDEVIGKDYIEKFVPEEDREKVADLFALLMRSQEPTLNENRVLTKDGRTLLIEWRGRPVYNENGRFEYFLGLGTDVSERRKTEKALRESELKFRSLFDFSPQAIALTDLETARIVDVNETFCRLTKYSRDEVLGWTSTERGFYSPEDRRRYVKAFQESGEVHGLEMSFRAKDDSVLNALMFARMIQIDGAEFILIIFLDITERKRLELQLQHAQRMEAVGTLAGGIAHDFNNLLMAVQGNVSLLLYDADPNDPRSEMLRSIEKQVKSGARLTSQLLGYARKGRYEVAPLCLNELAQDLSDAFARTRKDIQIIKDLEKGLYPLRGDQGQLEQVLMNLFVNAADAMPGGGRLTLRTANATHEDMKGNSIYDPKPGRYVSLQVSDTGVGMDKKTVKRIFEPFFTTKELGRGTGLGLASVYGIVKGHGGYIDVSSEKGEGTTFRIFLPAAFDKPANRVPSEPAVSSVRKGATILFVDDEEIVLEVGCKLLEKLGYRAIQAKSGREAVRIYSERSDDIQLVLLDMVMPELGGGETFDRLKAIDPNLKVLLSSGYSQDGQAAEILDRGCSGFIQKPFDLGELQKKITQALESE